jgi:hypothetical protein
LAPTAATTISNLKSNMLQWRRPRKQFLLFRLAPKITTHVATRTLELQPTKPTSFSAAPPIAQMSMLKIVRTASVVTS